jgi:hypothetical protein
MTNHISFDFMAYSWFRIHHAIMQDMRDHICALQIAKFLYILLRDEGGCTGCWVDICMMFLQLAAYILFICVRGDTQECNPIRIDAMGLKAHTRSQQQKGPPDCLCACNMHHCGLSCLLTRCLQNFFVYTGRIIGRAVRWEPVALNLTQKTIWAERTCWQDWVILYFVCKCGCAHHYVATKCIGDRFSAC